MDRTRAHKNLVNQILLALSKEKLGLFWANETGAARSLDGKRIVRFGLKGSPDIIGCYQGQFIGLEIKTGNARQTEPQQYFERALKKVGGKYHVINNVDEALKAVRGMVP